MMNGISMSTIMVIDLKESKTLFCSKRHLKSRVLSNLNLKLVLVEIITM
jgi:hypothetical protein